MSAPAKKAVTYPAFIAFLICAVFPFIYRMLDQSKNYVCNPESIIPKLDRAIGKFSLGEICAANEMLYVNFFAIILTYSFSYAFIYGYNFRSISLQSIRQKSIRELLIGNVITIFCLILLINMIFDYYYDDLTFKKRLFSIAAYNDILRYAFSQTLFLMIVTNFVIWVTTMLISARVFKRDGE